MNRYKNNEYKLRKYQIDVINKTLNTTKSTLIQIPTGGGKTLISKEIINEIVKQNKKILFVVPKLILMEQTINVFKELNPQIYHGNKKYDNNANIFISTIQTSSQRNDIIFDVIFVDEIHYGYDGKMLERLKSTHQNSRLIGLSATPYTKSGKLIEGFDVVLNNYDMKYLINHKYLSPLKSYELVQMDLSNVKITGGDYNLQELSKVVSNKHLISDIIYETKKFVAEHKKTIVFAVDIKHATLLENAYRKIGFDASAVHSKLSKDILKERFEAFEKKSDIPKILVSVMMITTGFDMPEVDCAVLARPTKSQNLYKQMVGRILRIDGDKQSATLLDCGNVIKELGMPLEPIKEKKVRKKNWFFTCPECKIGILKLTKKGNELCYLCSECDFELIYENIKGFKCENCNQLHLSKGENFELIDKNLYLKCECGHDTLILEYFGNQKFGLKEDNSKYLSFIEAREYVRNQNLGSWRKYFYFNKTKPWFIPNKPNEYYKDQGWINWSDFIGDKSEYDKDYFTYEKLKEYLTKFNVTTKSKWDIFLKSEKLKGIKIPIFPDQYYKNKGWKHWDDFLAIESSKKTKIKQTSLSFEEAKKYARELNLKHEIDWKNCYQDCFPYYNNPMDPKKIYEKEWISWSDWLGIGNY